MYVKGETCKRQLAVSGNAVDHPVIGEGNLGYHFRERLNDKYLSDLSKNTARSFLVYLFFIHI